MNNPISIQEIPQDELLKIAARYGQQVYAYTASIFGAESADEVMPYLLSLFVCGYFTPQMEDNLAKDNMVVENLLKNINLPEDFGTEE